MNATPKVPSGSERRRWPRADAEGPIMIELAEGAHEARVRDISSSGVCFFLDRPIALMTVLSVRLDLPIRGGRRKVHGSGAVVRCERISQRLEHYEIALYIQEMAAPDRMAVEDYVAGCETKSRSVGD